MTPECRAKVAETYPVIRTPEEQAEDFAVLIRNAYAELVRSDTGVLEQEQVRISSSKDEKRLFVDIVDEKVATRFAEITLTDDVDVQPYSVRFGKGTRLNEDDDESDSADSFECPVAIIPDLFLPSDDNEFNFNFTIMVPEKRLAVLADVLGDFQPAVVAD